MKKSKQVKRSQKHQKDWFKDVLDENKKLAIPIGPRFQADVSEWTGPPQRKYPHKTLTKSPSSKYLGTVIWSNKDTNTTPETGIGKGRPDTCHCKTPGSVSCVKQHIALKITRLQKDVGPAFLKWKFDEMGEAVAKVWKHSEQQKFTQIVKNNPISEGNNNFIKLALETFRSKSRSMIASFYFNVYLPRRISVKTRSGGYVDTDDDEEEEEKKTSNCSKVSRKRAHVDGVGCPNKSGKVGYLSGRR